MTSTTLRPALWSGHEWLDRLRPEHRILTGTAYRITITNYEKLHMFNPQDFAGVVCDESSILKNFQGARKTEITAFMRQRPYRLLATATAAPNGLRYL